MSARLVVLDASAAVDLLVRARSATWVEDQLVDRSVAVPGHMKAEVFSALGRRYRDGRAIAGRVEACLRELADLRVEAYPVDPLLMPAWARRDNLRLADALYVELAAQLDTVVITTDPRLARATPLAVAPPQ